MSTPQDLDGTEAVDVSSSETVPATPAAPDDEVDVSTEAEGGDPSDAESGDSPETEGGNEGGGGNEGDAAPEEADEEPVDVGDQLDLDDPAVLRGAVEAILFVSDVPIPPVALAAALRRPEPEILEALRALADELDHRRSGVELREVAGGHRLYTRSDLAAAVEQFLREGQRTRLTQAALETLAVIAYRQPISRGRVSAIRGVNVDGVARTLLTRGLIAEVGTDPDTGAGLYATTELFLEKLGLSGLDELPSLAPLLPDVDDLDAGEGLDVDRL